MNISSINAVRSYDNSLSFKARNQLNMRFLRDLRGVSCAYCGQTMLTLHQIIDYSQKMSSLKGKKLFTFLTNLEPMMKPNELAATRLIKEEVKKNPHDNIKGIFEKMFPTYVEKLEKQQKSVLNEIKNMAVNFSTADRELVLAQIERGIKGVEQKSDLRHFKRNKYLTEIYLLKDKFQNPADFEKIVAKTSSMPTTHTSIAAFIVKYSRKSPFEIGVRLLSPNQATIEHLKPRSLGGKNELPNLILACGHDNSSRSSQPLDVMVGLEKNLPEYFRTLKKSLAKKLPVQEFKKVNEYIDNVKKTINSLLSSKLHITDNSKGR